MAKEHKQQNVGPEAEMGGVLSSCEEAVNDGTCAICSGCQGRGGATREEKDIMPGVALCDFMEVS